MAAQRHNREEVRKPRTPELVPELDPDAEDSTHSANETTVPPPPGVRQPATAHLPPNTAKIAPQIRAPGWDNSGAMLRDSLDKKRAESPGHHKPVPPVPTPAVEPAPPSSGVLEPVQTDSANILKPVQTDSANALTPVQTDSTGVISPVASAPMLPPVDSAPMLPPVDSAPMLPIVDVHVPASGQMKIEFSPDAGNEVLEVTAEPLDTADIVTTAPKGRSPSGFRAEPPPPEDADDISESASSFSDSGTPSSRQDTVERALAKVEEDEEEIPPSPEITKRFDVILQLGKGGMAVVYLCRDPRQKGKIVAVKDIRTELKPGMRMAERVEHEVMLLKELDHPRIVKVYDLLKFQRGSAIIMEYIDGLPLDHEIGAGRRITWDFGVHILRDIGEALAYAHSRGVIHRDLKPDNILYSERHKVMKLVDFGLARLYGEEIDVSMTRTGMVVGTPHYMSPEQVSGKQLDQRSDVYSFGATLYYLITGQRHVEGSNIMDILEQQRSGNIIPPSYINRDMPDWLTYIIGKMMEIKADERYQSMNEVLADLRAAEDDPVNFVKNNPRGPVKRYGGKPLMPYEPEPEPALTDTAEERKVKARTAKVREEAFAAGVASAKAAAMQPGAPTEDGQLARATAAHAEADKPTNRVRERVEDGLPELESESGIPAPPIAVAQLVEISQLVREVSGRLQRTEEKVEKQNVSALTMFLIVLLSSLIAVALFSGALIYLHRTGQITLLVK